MSGTAKAKLFKFCAHIGCIKIVVSRKPSTPQYQLAAMHQHRPINYRAVHRELDAECYQQATVVGRR